MAFVSLCCDRNMNENDAISTGKMRENTRLLLVFPLRIFPPVKMTPFRFLSQDIQEKYR